VARVCAQDDEPAVAAAAYNVTMPINTAYQRQLVLYPRPFRLCKYSIVQCGDMIAADGQGRSHIDLRMEKTKLWATVTTAIRLQPQDSYVSLDATPVSADEIYWGNHGSSPGKDKGFFACLKCSDDDLEPKQLPTPWEPGALPSGLNEPDVKCTISELTFMWFYIRR